MKTEESKYKDCNGQIIFYGDILRLKDYKRESENSPKEPFFILTKKGIYTSGMDEFTPIEECKLKTDKIDELGAFEIFVPANIYEWILEE